MGKVVVVERRVVQRFSDLSGELLDETTGKRVEFSYRGSSFYIDLTNAEAGHFDELMTPYIEKASPVAQSRRAVGGRSYKAKEVRAWAQAEGHLVSDRGRLSVEIIELYQEAH